MEYIVLDLEWNQATPNRDTKLEAIPFEIIEIGAVKVNEQLEIVDRFHRLIRPRIYPELESNIRKLISISQVDLKKGTTFTRAFRDFFQWCGEEYIFCTWGSTDLIELQRNMKYYHFRPLSQGPFMYYNVQKLFAIFYDSERRNRALEYAVNYFHIQENGKFHSAIADATYTAYVLQHFNLEEAKGYMEIDYFHPPKRRKDQMYVNFADYAKFISMAYEQKEDLMRDKDVKKSKCCVCNKNVVKKIDWFTNNSKNYYGVFYCKQHGYLKGKMRVKKSDAGKVFIVKTMKKITEEEAHLLKDQKEKIKKKKNNNTAE